MCLLGLSSCFLLHASLTSFWLLRAPLLRFLVPPPLSWVGNLNPPTSFASISLLLPNTPKEIEKIEEEQEVKRNKYGRFFREGVEGAALLFYFFFLFVVALWETLSACECATWMGKEGKEITTAEQTVTTDDDDGNATRVCSISSGNSVVPSSRFILQLTLAVLPVLLCVRLLSRVCKLTTPARPCFCISFPINLTVRWGPSLRIVVCRKVLKKNLRHNTFLFYLFCFSFAELPLCVIWPSLTIVAPSGYNSVEFDEVIKPWIETRERERKQKQQRDNFRNVKMRLFRRRTDGQQLQESNSAGATEAAALLVSLESNESSGDSGADHDQLTSSRSERDTLDDNNYQTVKALPAIVVINSPKSHKNKGQSVFSFSFLWHFE